MAEVDEALEAGLYLVATPLGNLSDLSPRAREILSRASFLAGESSKVTRRWMEILAKDAPEAWRRPKLLTYREASRDKDARSILGHLEAGHSVAVISDAGTPAVSDPGWHLVQEAQKARHPIWAIPGACAAVTALSISGFPSRRFAFEGFLPGSGRHRRQALERLKQSEAPCILYESPHHLLKTLVELAQHLPSREVFVSREMTKKFEESWRGPLEEAAEVWSERTVKGEFTLVLGPRTPKESGSSTTEISDQTLKLLKDLDLPVKSASKILKHFFPQASKKELYKMLHQDRA